MAFGRKAGVGEEAMAPLMRRHGTTSHFMRNGALQCEIFT